MIDIQRLYSLFKECSSVTTDSRAIAGGEMFFGLKGENFDGNEYLEKIVQIPFEIPALSKSKLNNIFFNKLDDVINHLPDEIVWDQQYWGHVRLRNMRLELND